MPFSSAPKIVVSYSEVKHYDERIWLTLDMKITGGNKDTRKAKFDEMKTKIDDPTFAGKIKHAMNLAAGDGVSRDYKQWQEYSPERGADHHYEFGFTPDWQQPALPADKKDVIKNAMLDKACELLGAEKAAGKGKTA